MPLCDNCGSLGHWAKNCPMPKKKKAKAGKAKPLELKPKEVECEKCVLLEAEVSRLRAKYEMTAEEKLERIRQQNRKAQEKYRKNRGK